LYSTGNVSTRRNMSTIRVSKRERFTIIDRRLANDDSLSFKARGVLLWLLSKPDDWRCTADDISNAGTEGRDAVRSALKELRSAGYLVQTKVQDRETGRWSTETVVMEEPNCLTTSGRETPGRTEDGIPGVGNPDVGFPGAIEKTVTENPPTPQETPVEATEMVFGDDPNEIRAVGDREQIEARLIKRYGEPRTPGQKKVRASYVQTMLDRGWTPVEVSRRAETLKERWPNCDNPIAMLISRWDDWEPLTPGQRYGV
jgi:hypothetical protein